GDFLERALQVVARVVGIAAEPVGVGLHYPLRRIEQAFALRVVAGPAQQGAHRRLGLCARDAVALFVLVGHGRCSGSRGPAMVPRDAASTPGLRGYVAGQSEATSMP